MNQYLPMQFLCPAKNGTYAKCGLFFEFSLENLSGWNEFGSFQYFGSLCNTYNEIIKFVPAGIVTLSKKIIEN